MGGRALKSYTRRIKKEEFLKIQHEIAGKLTFELGYDRVYFIPYISSKLDFGDLDLLLPKPKIESLEEFLCNSLYSKELSKNGDIISFEYNQFQVDLIHTQKPMMAQTYFSYNDLGMLMGMLAKRVGCKYGTEGLFLEVYNNNKSKKWEIFLSDSPKEIFDFLNLDYVCYTKGFKTLTEVYDFICSSYLFDVDYFYNEKGWNHRKRTRNRKRPTWHGFIEYIKNIDIKNPIPRDNVNYCTEFFSKEYIYNELNKIGEEEHKNNVIKEKFNGNIVSSLTGLEGKELSYFMSRFKKQFKNFESFIYYSKPEEVNSKLKEFYYGKGIFK